MKKLIFLIVLVFMVVGCSESKEDKIDRLHNEAMAKAYEFIWLESCFKDAEAKKVREEMHVIYEEIEKLEKEQTH